jgi:hypothetical protein
MTAPQHLKANYDRPEYLVANFKIQRLIRGNLFRASL